MTKDEFRLLAISKVIDQLGGIDLHECACELNDGNEPKDSHYLSAVREALDVIVREEFGEVQPSDVSLPLEPTPAMVEAGASYIERWGDVNSTWSVAEGVYRTMLSANSPGGE